MTPRTPTPLRLLAVGVVIAGLGGAVALVEDAGAPAAAAAPGTAALRVAIDPDTGELVPWRGGAKALDAELAEMLSKSSEGLVEVRHPDGHVYVDLQGRFMSASLARIGAGGELEQTCVESAEAATGFLSGGDGCGHRHGETWEVR